MRYDENTRRYYRVMTKQSPYEEQTYVATKKSRYDEKNALRRTNFVTTKKVAVTTKNSRYDETVALR